MRRHLEPLERVDLLVNNAGLAAGLEHIDRGDTRDWGRHDRHQRQGAALRHTGDRPEDGVAAGPGGHIVNLGSIAGTEPYENGAVYCASKHAVHAISQSMRADLLSSGIKVTEIGPGMVETEFSRCVSTATGRGQPPSTKGSSPLTGADICGGNCVVAQLPAHMNVNDMVLMPSQQAGSYYTYRKKQ